MIADLDHSDTEESSMDSNDERVICHICKVDIPNSYVRVHMTSTIHHYNVKITGIALKRSRDHVKGDNNIFDTSIEKLVQDYCHICNVYYKDHFEFKHENSETHKKMIMYEKIIPKMYLLFKNTVNNLNVIDEIKEVFDQSFDNTVKNEKGMTYCDICDVSKHTQGFSGHLKGKRHKKKCAAKDLTVEHTKVVKSTAEKIYCNVCNVSKDASNFSFHENSTKHKKKLLKQYKNKETLDVDMKTKNNDVMNIKRLTESHFSKYIDSLFGSKYECKICNVNFEGESKVMEHLDTVDHLNKYRNILLSHDIIKLTNEYFCSKCDIFVPDVVEHVRGVTKHRHLIYLGLHEEYCELCKVKVPSAGVTTHNRGKGHKLKEKQMENESVNFINVNEIDDFLDEAAKYKTMITIKNNKLICKLCDVQLYPWTSCGPYSVDFHFNNDYLHTYNLTKYADKNSMEKDGDDDYRCTLCNKIVGRCNVYEHGESHVHKFY